MIIADTSAVLSAIDGSQTFHAQCARVISEADEVILSPFVLAELDYLLATRVGVVQERSFLAQVGSGAYTLPALDANDVTEALEIIQKFGDLNVGLTDASLCVLSRRHHCLDVATLDDRHFRILTGYRDRPFRLLPADS